MVRWSTGIYYVNRKGMEKIYNLYINNDKIVFNNNCAVADFLVYNNMVTYTYTKPLYIHQIIESTIHQNHINGEHMSAYYAIKNYFDKLSK